MTASGGAAAGGKLQVKFADPWFLRLEHRGQEPCQSTSKIGAL